MKRGGGGGGAADKKWNVSTYKFKPLHPQRPGEKSKRGKNSRIYSQISSRELKNSNTFPHRLFNLGHFRVVLNLIMKARLSAN